MRRTGRVECGNILDPARRVGIGAELGPNTRRNLAECERPLIRKETRISHDCTMPGSQRAGPASGVWVTGRSSSLRPARPA